MNNCFVPIQTADLIWQEGLPFSKLFNDVYFSRNNGLEEKRHVFIEGNHLPERWEAMSTAGSESFVIGETGFGTGLNFLLTWSLWLRHAPQSATLHFFSCEKFPLKPDDLQTALALWPELQKQSDALIANYPILTPGFHHLKFENGRVNLTLMLGEASDCYKQLLLCGDIQLEAELRDCFFDAWYLDGFSPSKNQGIWDLDLLHSLALLSKPGTSLTSYSVASLVRANLAAVGFTVEKTKGFARKNEMTIAHFNSLALAKLKDRTTPWHIAKTVKVKDKKAIVLGAGLAGCYTAHALASRGWQVSLLDAEQKPGLGASGNTQAVLYPKFSAHRSPLTLFMLSAFLYASRSYSQLLQQASLGQLKGSLQLAYDEKEELSQADLQTWLRYYPELGQLLSRERASELAGIELNSSGLFIPLSGWLNSQALCHHLLQTPGIVWSPGTQVETIHYENNLWQLAGQSAEILILCNGYQAKQFAETAGLPIKSIAGQMTLISANSNTSRLKVPLCGDGHVLPEHQGLHAIGASYHLGSTSNCYSDKDDQINLQRLDALVNSTLWTKDVKGSWSGVRAATTDYLPLVGPVAIDEQFKAEFASLAANSKRWLPFSGSYYPGLFICAGFGSRGLTTVPLAAEYLAALINREPCIIPREMAQSLSPARFLRKGIVKNLTG